MGIGELVGLIIFGAVIGALARLVIPGKQAMGWIITIVIGIAGALIGYWLWGMLASEGNADTGGIDWIRWLISIAAAVILTLGYTAITRDKKV
ncbi:GlsB/YeaQ/YmgE family stress response membrane protein [Mycolicibacterium austroafricanum]|uniref:GlsB/YeaQ/YmgE family stress response membrane protein n=1 Tax=Mycolicibacterium austroafricanum TaxID=39687 RepID=UPI003B82CE98